MEGSPTLSVPREAVQPTERRVQITDGFVLAILGRIQGPGLPSFEQLFETGLQLLTGTQDPPTDEALYTSLRRRLLVVDDGGQWRLRVPLMHRWLRQRG